MAISPVDQNTFSQPAGQISETGRPKTSSIHESNPESASRQVSGLFDFFNKDRVPAGEIRQWLKERVFIPGLDGKPTTEANGRMVDKLFPAFQKLNNCLPEGLKLIMSKSPEDFKIRICESREAFLLNPDPDNEVQRLIVAKKEIESGGRTLPALKDKITIELYCDTSEYKHNLNETVFHELLHATDKLVVEDSEKEEKTLSYSNQKISMILQSVGTNYNNRKQSALEGLYQSCLSLHKRGLLSASKRVELMKKIYKKHKVLWGCTGCWSERLKIKGPALPLIDSVEEVLVCGLQVYLNKEKRALLKKEEPELYKLIEEVIIPKIKERARELKVAF